MSLVSIVIPIYNEQENIENLLKRICAIDVDKEVILVNDGSSDNSEQVIRSNLDKYPEVRLISLSRNMGQSTALACGFDHAQSEYIVMMDGDLQNHPEDVIPLLEKIQHDRLDCVSGRRKKRVETNPFRKFPSKVANKLIRKAVGCEVKDMGGMNIMRAQAVKGINLKNGYHRIIPALIHIQGGSVSEIDIKHDKRVWGVSKYTTISRIFEVLFDIILLWFKTSSKSRPLYVFGKISLITLITSIVIFIFLLIQRQFYGIDMGTRPLFIIDVILFLSSLGFFSLGVLTELIQDLQMRVSQRAYMIKYDSAD